MDKIFSKGNMMLALKKVQANKGASGVDRISTEDIDKYLKENCPSIKKRILRRRYKPQPVLRVEMPKSGGGIRIEYFNGGYLYVVDIDLEKFFDNVPQDKLMTLVGKILKDLDTESLISKYLKAGVMVKGRLEGTPLGTPQGGNLSPILSNIMLNELDKELAARKLNFVHYADDCIIVVRSSAAANRVMNSISSWIERKLSLKVNMRESKVTRPTKLKFLTRRSWSISMDDRIKRLNWVIRGWINYFRIAKMKTHMICIDKHLRTRIRIVIWKQWKTKERGIWGLRKLEVPEWMAKQSAGFGDHYQAVVKTTDLHGISKRILTMRGLVSCLDYYLN